MPAFMHASVSSCMALALKAMMGTLPFSPGRRRISRVASIPSISGMCTSISTTS